MHVYSYKPQNYRAQRPKKHLPKKLIYAALFLIVIGLAVFIIKKEPALAPATNTQNAPSENSSTTLKVEPLSSVQDIVDNFVENNAGTYSVVVTDLATGTELAAYEIDEPYFAASIYKLYIAYLGYLDIQEGKYSFDDAFLGDWTRKECLDKMIRESHSPCAEKLWVEQGKEKSTERLKEKFELTGTSMVGLTTTAKDVNIILERLHGDQDLNESNTALYMDSLKQNIYRDVLPAALPELTVYDKVGFNGLVEYHDVGIVKLPNNRDVAITMLSRNAGTRRLVALTKVIFLRLEEDDHAAQ